MSLHVETTAHISSSFLCCYFLLIEVAAVIRKVQIHRTL